MNRYFFTRKDYEALCARVTQVEQKVREHTVAVGQVVDSSGDAWHDNQLYYEQRMSESWSSNLRTLMGIKRNAEIVDTYPPQDGIVRFGSVVKIQDLESKAVFIYEISSFMVADPQGREGIKRISYDSPIGRLLINARVDDIIERKIGNNEKRFKILEIAQLYS